MKLLEVEGEHVPQCPIAGDATAVASRIGHVPMCCAVDWVKGRSLLPRSSGVEHAASLVAFDVQKPAL